MHLAVSRSGCLKAGVCIVLIRRRPGTFVEERMSSQEEGRPLSWRCGDVRIQRGEEAEIRVGLWGGDSKLEKSLGTSAL